MVRRLYVIVSVKYNVEMVTTPADAEAHNQQNLQQKT